ncbi:MAG TPA: diacylglycerol kinase family protein [Caulobacteraceae bacterium]|jgi:diacylglycerol kinase family enzyme
MTAELVAEPRNLCEAAKAIRKIEVLVNPLSGSVGSAAPQEAEQLLSEFGIDYNITVLESGEVPQQVKAAVEAAPDLVIVVAGDGTARAVANLCGPEGPLVAPLAGGTMNMLPHAIYGEVDWKQGLINALTEGEVATISGGEVDGRSFYVAAILGAPALFGYAREAAREHHFLQAMRYSRNAYAKVFSNKVKYSFDGSEPDKAEAVALLCPLVSKKMNDQRALEAAAINPKGAADAFKLGVRTMLSNIAGDWRRDPNVTTACIQSGRAWSSGSLPAILDGEPTKLHKVSDIRFRPNAFRVLAPPSAPEPVNPVTG